MTKVVLFLTALPLAAILALILNALLERATERREVAKSLAFVVLGATILLFGSAPADARASTSEGLPCAKIECSLEVDRQQLDQLWNKHQPGKVKLLYQSRIPVTEQTLRENDSPLLVEGEGRRRPPRVSPPVVGEVPLETPRP